jgi:hypothetical protein
MAREYLTPTLGAEPALLYIALSELNAEPSAPASPQLDFAVNLQQELRAHDDPAS